jgi:predicted AlkP superfamily pyrophosphatase or phosphodiesterase
MLAPCPLAGAGVAEPSPERTIAGQAVRWRGIVGAGREIPKMLTLRRSVVFAIALLMSACASQGAPAPDGAGQPRPLTILVSIDGFRPDYLTKADAPTMYALSRKGVFAPEGMKPSFPSLTFPNHYTLVTGVRPDRSGMVHNTFEAPDIPGVRFSLGNKSAVTDGRFWSQAEPIWITAERAGVKTGTMFWPGSEAEINGLRPSLWTEFNQAMPSAARVDVLLGWLDDPAGGPGFATLYFDIVDTAGHYYGPDSPEVRASVAEVDAAIARLLAGLEARGLGGKVNLVIVADHGMAPVPPGQTIVADAEAPGVVRMIAGGAAAGFALVPGKEAEGEALLLKAHPNMTCWRREEIPARYGYGRNPRVAPIVCLAKLGWYISNAESVARRKPSERMTGAHGYDPEAPEMAALFLAVGPDIRRGATVRGMVNVDVYPLLVRLIGVEPVDGVDGRLPAGVLR